MSVVVEDGSVVANANSYLSSTAFKAYADARGWDYSSYSDVQLDAALIRGSAAIDNKYLAQWDGVRTGGRLQRMQWPRKQGGYINGIFVLRGPLTTVTDVMGVPIAINEVPGEIISAAAEATWRELQSPGVMYPDLDRGGSIKSVSAGSVSVEYNSAAPNMTAFTAIDAILASLIALGSGSSASPLTGRAVEA